MNPKILTIVIIAELFAACHFNASAQKIDSELYCIELTLGKTGEEELWNGSLKFAIKNEHSKLQYANINKGWQEKAGISVSDTLVTWHGKSVRRKVFDWAVYNNERTSGYTSEKDYMPFKPVQVFVNCKLHHKDVLVVDVNNMQVEFSINELDFDNTLEYLKGRLSVKRIIPGLKLTDTPYIGDRYKYHGFPAVTSSSDGKTYIVYSTYHEGISPFRYHSYTDHVPENFSYLAQPSEGDQINITIEKNGKIIESLPITSKGKDIFDIAAATDAMDNVWIAWSEHQDGNQDIWYTKVSGKKVEPAKRLTVNQGPDIHPVLAAHKNDVWIAWQGFRDDSYDILYTKLTSDNIQKNMAFVGKTTANEWQPAIAADKSGNIAIAWDTYKNGNYDVYYALIDEKGQVKTESHVAATENFEARPSIVFDDENRLWVAYELAGKNWGKDNGSHFFIQPEEETEGLYETRSIRMVCIDNGKFFTTNTPVEKAIPNELKYTFFYDFGAKPELFNMVNEPNHYLNYPVLAKDAQGNICLIYKKQSNQKKTINGITRWESYFMRYNGETWTEPLMLYGSYGQMHEKPAVTITPDNHVKIVHASDRQGNCSIDDPDQFCQNIWISYPRINHHSNKPFQLQPLPDPVASGKTAMAEKEEEDVKTIRNYRTSANGKTYRILKGDSHRHSAFSGDGGTDSQIEDSHRYALDAASLDWFSNGDHDNGYNEYYWNLTQKYSDIFHFEGYHTPLFGYERSNGFPDGHRNVIFSQRGIRMLPRLRYNKSANKDTSPDVALLYRYLDQFNGICISHTSATLTAGTDWRSLDTKNEPVVEIYQGERMSAECETCPRFDSTIPYHPVNKDGFYRAALAKGHHLGIISSSDHRSTHISFAMVYVRDFSRKGIMQGLKERHTYGATDNIVLDVKMNGHLMGDILEANERQLDIKIIGTEAIKDIVVVKDNMEYPVEHTGKSEVSVSWKDKNISDKESYYYVRIKQIDGELAWSSPIWCTKVKD